MPKAMPRTAQLAPGRPKQAGPPLGGADRRKAGGIVSLRRAVPSKLAPHWGVPTGGRLGGGASAQGLRSAPPISCRLLACVTLLPGGTLRVSHTLPPMVDPRPMVTRPSTVAPA